jgi:hypothetical protein
MKLWQDLQPGLDLAPVVTPSPNSGRASALSRAAHPAIDPRTGSFSGHLVALMRLRNSTSSASGVVHFKRAKSGVITHGYLPSERERRT